MLNWSCTFAMQFLYTQTQFIDKIILELSTFFNKTGDKVKTKTKKTEVNLNNAHNGQRYKKLLRMTQQLKSE